MEYKLVLTASRWRGKGISPRWRLAWARFRRVSGWPCPLFLLSFGRPYSRAASSPNLEPGASLFCCRHAGLPAGPGSRCCVDTWVGVSFRVLGRTFREPNVLTEAPMTPSSLRLVTSRGRACVEWPHHLRKIVFLVGQFLRVCVMCVAGTPPFFSFTFR